MIARRSILRLLGASAACGAALQTGRQAFALAGVLPAGAGLANPPVVGSEDGVLRTTLTVGYGRASIPQGSAHLRLYNGALPGPTWRVRAGERLDVTLVNTLPPNPEPELALPPGLSAGDICVSAAHNQPNCPNTTNLHFHGLHVSPSGRSDNVFLEIAPGEEFHYLVDIPVDHPPGTYWYHPHRHGSVALQVASGMAGMIIVDEPSGPPALTERHLVIQSPIVDRDGVLEDPRLMMALEDERYFLVNGTYLPKIGVGVGETQLWRLLSANDSQFLPLDFDEIPGVEATLVGFDGLPLPAPRRLGKLTMAPGNRADVLVTGRAAGNFLFGRKSFAQGILRLPAAPIADIVVSGSEPGSGSGTAPASAALYPGAVSVAKYRRETVADDEVTVRRTIELGNERVADGPLGVRYTINGAPHQAGVFPIVAKLGGVEEWTFVNMTPFPHPMHVHVNPFQVFEINGRAVPELPWMDTLIVPAAGVARVRMRFEDFAGDFVMHCHILPHEDAGMMMNVRIEA